MIRHIFLCAIFVPAFLGAWTQYPPPVVDVTTLRPDAMVISHEHSDHFHEPTLVEFDRSIPIFIPDFPNRRLVERLGFEGTDCRDERPSRGPRGSRCRRLSRSRACCHQGRT